MNNNDRGIVVFIVVFVVVIVVVVGWCLSLCLSRRISFIFLSQPVRLWSLKCGYFRMERDGLQIAFSYLMPSVWFMASVYFMTSIHFNTLVYFQS